MDKCKNKPREPLVSLAAHLTLFRMSPELEAIHSTKNIWNTESRHVWCGTGGVVEATRLKGGGGEDVKKE